MSLDQFTTAASDYAAKVDHPFYLLSAISGLFVALVTGLPKLREARRIVANIAKLPAPADLGTEPE